MKVPLCKCNFLLGKFQKSLYSNFILFVLIASVVVVVFYNKTVGACFYV